MEKRIIKFKQICVSSGMQDYPDALYALSEDGEIYYRDMKYGEGWIKIENPDFLNNK